jgi:uncharacterized protein with HEPN domain
MIRLGLVEVDKNRLAETCRRYGVRELSVFGSAARGEARPDSDIDLLVEFLATSGLTGFRESELVRSAVVQKLAVIGEAATRISDELKARHPEVPWPRIVGLRIILIHACFGIDWDVVWRAASRRCPGLRDQVARILAAEFGGAGFEHQP